ncbi:4,5-dihydroxyphthalate decarboxylase [Halorubrum sp. DTA98]|uniref:4,5-dihydroxyphthalate decarboxylase n=1 Tax=Halorubrum sp. DTA98 TaxID=3402163 RepID=UPI003AACCA42
MTVDFTLACHEYEWTKALWDGRVEPQGLELTTVDYTNPERFNRMANYREFDACEMSMGSYLATRSQAEEYPFTALPIFPSRKFRHAYIYKRTGAGIDSLADLEGRDVGIVNWQTTTGIWQRGIARERHGLDTTSVTWKAAKPEIVDLNAPSYDIEFLDRAGRSLYAVEDMIERGEVDAVFHPVFLDADNAERLFADPIETETQYYRETSIFPIMHTVVIRDDLLEEKPWIPQKLYDAFERAKRIGLESLERPREFPIIWANTFAERQHELFGEDPWEYGLTEDNVTTLETLIEYAHEQEVIPREYTLEELFETEHVNTEEYR